MRQQTQKQTQQQKVSRTDKNKKLYEFLKLKFLKNLLVPQWRIPKSNLNTQNIVEWVRIDMVE